MAANPKYCTSNLAEDLLPALMAYADDVIILARRIEDITGFFTTFREELRQLGLEMNLRKT